MDAVDTKNEKPDKEERFADETTQDLKDDVFRQVREISHLVANARLQAREADIRARYAAEFAERAISEAQLAHMVASTLARTGRVVASMALELANNLSLDTSGDGDFLSFSLPNSSYSMQSGDSSRISGNTSLEESFASPATEMNSVRNPRRRSPPKVSPVPAATKTHETTYPEDLSPVSSLADLLSGSKSLPIVWEDSYSNGWESTPEPWAHKKNTLQMLRKLHSRKENKQKPRELDDDTDSDKESEETFPPVYLDSETQTTVTLERKENRANAGLEVGLKAADESECQRRRENAEIQVTVNDKLENMLEEVVKTQNETESANDCDVAREIYQISGFGLDD